MGIYLVNYIVIAIVCFLYYNKKIKLNTCIFLCCLSLWIIVGLRHITLGLVDTEKVYMPHFNSIYNNGLSAVLTEKDTVFYYITYLFIKIFGYKPWLYLLFMSFPYIFSVGNIIKKYSKNIFLSFIIFASLQYYEISFTLMRQVIAIGILLFSFKYLKNKNVFKFIGLVLIASLFHKMALVFLVAYPFMHIKAKNRIRLIILTIVAFFIVSQFYPDVIRQVANYLFEDSNRFNAYTVENYNRTTNLVFFVSCLMLSGVGLFYIKKKDFKSDEDLKTDQILLSLSLLATLFSPGTVIIREFSRVAYFFGIYNICMVPNAVTYEKNKKTRFIINLAMTIFFIVYFIFFMGQNANIIPYKFYWYQ